MKQTNTVTWLAKEGTYELKPLTSSIDLPSNEVITVTSPFRQTEIDESKFIGAFYTNTAHNEAEVLTLRIDNNPVGYLMRVSAAFSLETGYENTSWFKKAAVQVGKWALQYAIVDFERTFNEGIANINVDDIFEESISILILNTDSSSIKKINSIYQLDAQMFSLGFKRLNELKDNKWSPGEFAVSKFKEKTKSLNLKFINTPTRHVKFIENIFSSYIPDATLPLVRFFYFYQIIELLIEEIGNESLEASLIKLIDYRQKQNTALFRKEAQALQSLFNEKTKLNKLFSYQINASIELNLLRQICIDAMKALGDNSEFETSEAVYAIRNQIFHNYRVSGIELEKFLPEINELFEVVISSLFIEVFQKNTFVHEKNGNIDLSPAI